MERYAVGRAWRDDPARYHLLSRPALDKPCPTLTATAAQVSAASVAHPTACRKFTPAECKAICGFPADFVLTGTRKQRVERMGRAVSPPLMRAVATELATALRVLYLPTQFLKTRSLPRFLWESSAEGRTRCSY
jgi:DNA (cytosine-5)-methyltransferase 1